MKALEKAVDRPLPTFLGAFIIVFFGVWALFETPVKRAPSIKAPFSLVMVPYVGATPEEVETEIVLELEEELAKLDGLRHLDSVAGLGAASVSIQFEDNVDIDDALADVREAVDKAEPEFNDDVEVPVVREMSTDDQPIIFFTISGDIGQERLRSYAEDLKPRLEAVAGVSEVDVFGGFEPEVRVFANPAVLAEYDLTLSELADQVRRQSTTVPAGQLRSSEREQVVRATGEFTTIEEIRSLVVATEPAGPIMLRDVAQVELHHKRRDSYSWLNGEPSVTLQVKRLPDVNTMKTVEILKEKVDRYAQSLPPGVTITPTNDAAKDISMMIGQLSTSGVFGLVLVLGVLFAMFGKRQALLVGSVLPFSLLFTFIGLYVFDMSISNMSIFSLILVLGLVVDGAIIVGEAIYAEREAGASSKEAAKRGIARVGTPVFAADFTTIAAFAPMMLMIGIMGQFMSVMPKVVTFAITGSMFVDHLLIPAAVARFGIAKPRAPKDVDPDKAPWFSTDLTRLRRLYARSLDIALRRRSLVASGAIGAFALAIVLITTGVIGTIFMPQSDRGRVTIHYSLPLGTPIAETNRVGALISRELETVEEIERYVLSTGGGGGGGGGAFGPMGQGRTGPEYGTFRVELLPPRERVRTQTDIVDVLRDKLDKFAGIDVEVSGLQEGPVGAALHLNVRGSEFREVVAAAYAVDDVVRRTEGVRDIQFDYERANPELRIDVDRPRAASAFGISPNQVSRDLLTATVGAEVGRMWVGDERVDIRVGAPEDYGQTASSVSELPLRASDGGLVPLGEIAKIDFAFAPQTITRHDTFRTIAITAAAKTGYDTVGISADVRRGIAELDLPETVAVDFGGQTEEQTRSMGSLILAFPWALVLIYCIIAIQFNSLRQPFIVLACIPLSIFGVTMGLLLTGIPFSFAVLVGVVSLTGIVVNDGIVMIDGINHLRRSSDLSLGEAIRIASERRLRPVLLTTVTTIAGILPLALNLTEGGEFWVPLATAIISGLLVASLLTLIVVPVIYSLVEGGLRSLDSEPAPAAWSPKDPGGEPSRERRPGLLEPGTNPAR